MTSKCFVLMPFKEPFNSYYKQILVPAIEAARFKPVRADEIYGTRPIIEDIFKEIKGAAVLVADVTGKNPNVNYELGIAHALRRPVVIISQSIDDIPFDYRHLRVIIYDITEADWEEKLKSNITYTLLKAEPIKWPIIALKLWPLSIVVGLLLLFLMSMWLGLFDCWLGKSDDFYRGYTSGKIEILTENSRAGGSFYGVISNVLINYEELKVVVYVGVKNDAWNIHPEKESFSEIRADGSWNIPWVQRGVKSRRPEKVCAFLIPRKCVPTPEIIKSFGEIKRAAMSPVYTIIGDSSLVAAN